MLRCARRARETRLEEARQLNFELAGLISFAFHAPKKMPKYKPVRPEPRRETSSPADDAKVRAYLIGLSMQKGG